jgi:hypothetical protein
MGKNTATFMLQNHHILIVKYIGQTNYTPSRVKIISERFKVSKTIEYDHEFNNTLDIAEDWLKKNGFELVGCGEGKGHYYIITSTFKPLK